MSLPCHNNKESSVVANLNKASEDNDFNQSKLEIIRIRKEPK